MSDINKEILKIIRRARDRMHGSVILGITVKTLLVALGAYLLIIFVARFFPIYNPYYKGLLLACGISFIGFLFSLFMPPKNEAAALCIDSKGLAERTITAYELIGDDTEIAMMQKKDTLEHLKNINIKEAIRIKWPKKLFSLCLLLICLILVSAAVPNSMGGKAAELNKVKQEIKEQKKEIEKVIKKIEGNKKITMEQKKEVLEKLDELKKELNGTKDINESKKSIKRAENKIEMARQKYDDKNMDRVIDVFSKNEATKDLAKSLQNADYDRIKKDIENATKALQQSSEENIKELKESLDELAEALKSDSDLASAIISLSEKIANGELGDMDAEVESLARELERLAQDAEFKKAMDDVINQLSCASCQSGDGQGQGQGKSGGTQGGEGSGSGSGAGSGSGIGDGSTEGSSGAGLGKKETTGGELKEYEKVFATRLLGGEGDKDILQGNKNPDGQTKIFETEQGLTIKGEMLPYDQVIGQYKEQAFQNIESSQIPQGMQNIVKEYFSSLED